MAPNSDRALLLFGLAAFGLAVSLAVLVYGIVEGDVVLIAGFIGVMWSSFSLVRQLAGVELRVREAYTHLIAGSALILAMAVAVSSWMQMLLLLGAYVAAFAVYLRWGRWRSLRGTPPREREPTRGG